MALTHIIINTLIGKSNINVFVVSKNNCKIEIFNKLAKWISREMERNNRRPMINSLDSAKVMRHL